MFKTRLISGIVLVIIALATIISGSWILFFTLLAVSLIGMRELYNVMKVSNEHVTVLELVGYLGAVLYYIAIKFDFGNFGMMAVIVSMILILFVYVFGYPKYHAEQVMAAFFGVVYVAVMLSFIYLTRNLPDGKFLVWLIFLCSWGCDTCAYCVGMLIGKHKMAPVLSPKKSIEGAVGGVVGAALLGVIYAAATQGKMAEYALICGVGALISMVGDLAASAIKRNQGIKDYGKLIPGHGGILDRFDSVIFTAPVPNSRSTYSSAMMGISRLVVGRAIFFPTSFPYRSSLGFTATAVSPGMVSGRLVAMVRYWSFSPTMG